MFLEESEGGSSRNDSVHSRILNYDKDSNILRSRTATKISPLGTTKINCGSFGIIHYYYYFYIKRCPAVSRLAKKKDWHLSGTAAKRSNFLKIKKNIYNIIIADFSLRLYSRIFSRITFIVYTDDLLAKIMLILMGLKAWIQFHKLN